MTVLILSTAADAHARVVLAQLAARGASAELLDLSEFPADLGLSMHFQAESRRFALRRLDGSGAVDMDAVHAVWWRRPQAFRLPAQCRDATAQRLAQSESMTAMQGLYQSLDAFWINEPGRDAMANHKPWQLSLAQQVGLEIPETLMTNDPQEARAFWAAHPQGLVFKQFIALPEAWSETRRLRPEDMRHADAVRIAPIIFQQQVEAVADLRVLVVGERVFAAATDVRQAAYPQDVRMNLSTRYAPHALPEPVTQKLLALMQRMGLVYGAADFRLTPQGRYVFLEINPAGQFLYIENDTNQPIAAAIAEALLRGHRQMPQATPEASQATPKWPNALASASLSGRSSQNGDPCESPFTVAP